MKGHLKPFRSKRALLICYFLLRAHHFSGRPDQCVYTAHHIQQQAVDRSLAGQHICCFPSRLVSSDSYDQLNSTSENDLITGLFHVWPFYMGETHVINFPSVSRVGVASVWSEPLPRVQQSFLYLCIGCHFHHAAFANCSFQRVSKRTEEENCLCCKHKTTKYPQPCQSAETSLISTGKTQTHRSAAGASPDFSFSWEMRDKRSHSPRHTVLPRHAAGTGDLSLRHSSRRTLWVPAVFHKPISRG